jgi:hypothetical protein
VKRDLADRFKRGLTHDDAPKYRLSDGKNNRVGPVADTLTVYRISMRSYFYFG